MSTSYTTLRPGDADLVLDALQNRIPADRLRRDLADIQEAFSQYRSCAEATKRLTWWERFLSNEAFDDYRKYGADLDFAGWKDALRARYRKLGHGWAVWSMAYAELVAAGVFSAGNSEHSPYHKELEKALRDALPALQAGRTVYFPTNLYRELTSLTQ